MIMLPSNIATCRSLLDILGFGNLVLIHSFNTDWRWYPYVVWNWERYGGDNESRFVVFDWKRGGNGEAGCLWRGTRWCMWMVCCCFGWWDERQQEVDMMWEHALIRKMKRPLLAIYCHVDNTHTLATIVPPPRRATSKSSLRGSHTYTITREHAPAHATRHPHATTAPATCCNLVLTLSWSCCFEL